MNQKIRVVLKDSVRYQSPLDEEVESELVSTNFEGNTNIILGRWSELNMGEIAPLIESWSVQNLSVESNQQINIINQVVEIKFINLTHLNLRLNRIENLELLAWLRAPCLLELFLDSNQFFRVSPMRNCDFPQLRQLSLAANKITDIGALVQMRCPQLKRIYLQWFIGITSNCDLGFLAKIQSNNLINIWIQHPERIIQTGVLRCLKKKYRAIRFQTFRPVRLEG